MSFCLKPEGRSRKAVLPALLFCVALLNARVLFVPADYETISEAVNESIDLDTVLVSRGTYHDQLWFPAHRIAVMSFFVLTGDSADLTETIIDGSSYADRDTATIALFLPQSADSSMLCGFTLTGGHGILDSAVGSRYSGAVRADSSHSVICHNRITRNTSACCPAVSFDHSSSIFRCNQVLDNNFQQSSVVVGYNLYEGAVRIEDNFFGENPSSEQALLPGVWVLTGALAELRGNSFVGLQGIAEVCIGYYGLNPRIENNSFRDIRCIGEYASAIHINSESNIVIVDNIFDGIMSDYAGAIEVLGGRNLFQLFVEGNVFQNIRAQGVPVAAAIWSQGFRAEVGNNIFRNTMASNSGGVFMTGYGVADPRPWHIERNLFEACSTFTSQSSSGACAGRAYGGEIIAHQNIFLHNYPVVTREDRLFPDNIADFTQNYWGDSTGPYHPTANPNGRGDPVGDNVMFAPWLTDTILSAAHEKPEWIPREFSLTAFPNPFNADVRLTLAVPEPARYRIDLYDVTGRHAVLVWEGAVVIEREVAFTAGGLASGVYFARAVNTASKQSVASAKLVLIK